MYTGHPTILSRTPSIIRRRESTPACCVRPIKIKRFLFFKKPKKLKSARDSMTCTPPDIACMALCTPRYRRVSVTTPEATAVGLAVHVSGNIHVGHSSSKKRPNGSTARMVVRDHGSHFEWSTCADALRACFALSPSFGSVSANCMFLGGPKRRLCVRIRTNAIMIGGVKNMHAACRKP